MDSSNKLVGYVEWAHSKSSILSTLRLNSLRTTKCLWCYPKKRNPIRMMRQIYPQTMVAILQMTGQPRSIKISARWPALLVYLIIPIFERNTEALSNPTNRIQAQLLLKHNNIWNPALSRAPHTTRYFTRGRKSFSLIILRSLRHLLKNTTLLSNKQNLRPTRLPPQSKVPKDSSPTWLF